MCIGIENIPMIKHWLKTGKRHIRGHKTKSKEDLTELTTSEEGFLFN